MTIQEVKMMNEDPAGSRGEAACSYVHILCELRPQASSSIKSAFKSLSKIFVPEQQSHSNHKKY